jgi:enterochelin esterase-like enzyme
VPQWLADLQLTSEILIGVLAGITVVLLAIVLVTRRRRLLIGSLIGAGAGAGVGLLLAWIVTGPVDVVEADAGPITLGWVAFAFAGGGVGLAALILGPRPRRSLGFLLGVAAILTGALGVNADVGQFPTVGSIFNGAAAGPMPADVAAAQAAGAPGDGGTRTGPADALWKEKPAAGQPRQGLVARVDIPATVSGFSPRPGYVYLPPAALAPNPPKLPVLVLLSGQPGGPVNIILAGRLTVAMNQYARTHGGLTPIIVVPDQLGAATNNPMCVDGPLGNSATYITVDVPHWIRTHLTVQTQVGAWGVGGYSQGGTCSLQFGTGFPDLFGTIVDMSGEARPADGSRQQTIDRGFGGDEAAYEAADPSTIMQRNAPYADTVAIIATGQYDQRYGPQADRIAAEATAAGITVVRQVVPGTSHDWHMVRWVFTEGIGPVMQHLGIQR